MVERFPFLAIDRNSGVWGRGCGDCSTAQVDEWVLEDLHHRGSVSVRPGPEQYQGRSKTDGDTSMVG